MEQLISISKIFNEKIYRIPDYQRGYAWTLKEIKDFWGDLQRLEADKNHYVGVLTLEEVKKEKYTKWIDDLWIIKAKKYVPYHVVDGQQRLTTAIILIYTIYELMQDKKIDRLNYTTEEEIARKYIFEYQDENKNRTYMYAYENDNPSYEYLITKIYNEKLITVQNYDDTVYTNNLYEAKKFFAEKLKDMTVEELEDVYTKITQHFLFNTYTISDDIDVFVTFETMNNRGKALSDLELLKNRMIYVSTLFPVKEEERIRLRRDINNCWKKIYHILGKGKDRELLDDEFLSAHFLLYFINKIDGLQDDMQRGFYSKDSLQTNYLLNEFFVVSKIVDKSLTVSDCFEYINSLSECIEFWGSIKNPYSSSYNKEVQEYIDKINILTIKRHRYFMRRYMSVYSKVNVFMLACFRASKGDERTLLKFLKAFEKYLFVLEFLEGVSLLDGDFEFLSFTDIVAKLNSGDMVIGGVIDKLDRMYVNMVKSNDCRRQTIKYYNQNGFYRTSWIRYFLCEYELSLMKKSKSNLQKIDVWDVYENTANSIEHIYPENSHSTYWLKIYSDFSSKQRKSLKNSLGNLVAISNTKNGKLGNKPFPEKKGNSQNSLGYKYGTYAEIELTEYDDWNEEAILKRGIKLITFLNERWGIQIGDSKKEDKKKFLGIEFIK